MGGRYGEEGGGTGRAGTRLSASTGKGAPALCSTAGEAMKP